MALVFRGKTECPLCHQVIVKDDEIVGTTHFIADSKDSLWQYSDAAFHRRCFLTWERREEFVAQYNQLTAGSRGHHMESDGSVV